MEELELQQTMFENGTAPTESNTTVQLSEKQHEAVTLHRKILTDGQIAADSLVALAEDLKRMRDTKLYMELGYSDFGDYCEKAAGIRQRQAYNFIKSLEEFGKSGLQANASLGITKLAALATLAEDDRAQLMEQENVKELSTRELQAKIDELQRKCDQLSLLNDDAQNERDKLEESSAARIRSLQARLNDTGDAMRKAAAEAKELRRRVNELESRPIEVAVAEPSEEQLKEIREEMEAEFETKAKTIRELERNMSDKALKAKLEAEKAKKAAEKKAAELEKQIADLQATATIAPPQGDNKAIIKHLFAEIQRQMNEAMDIIAKDAEKDKYKAAFAKLLQVCKETVEAI